MNLRRGFKSEAERIAQEVREELELSPLDALDVFVLAAHLEIPVFGMRDAAHYSDGAASFLLHFASRELDSFSAMTVFNDGRRVIIHNEFHAPTRQASNIAHELSHCLLEHEPSPVFSPEGCRHWNSSVEDEATWLAGTLLVPREGALAFCKRNWTIERIAEHFAVSEALCRQRINQTGIRLQIQRLATSRRHASG